MLSKLRALLPFRPPAVDGYTFVCRMSGLRPGRARAFRIGEYEVALFRQGDKVNALDSKCPHNMGPLHEGPIRGRSVACPWHGWLFSLETGESPGGHRRVPTFDVLVRDGYVYVANRPRCDYRGFAVPAEALASRSKRGEA